MITALHNAGLATLTHTLSSMRFLRDLLGRPKREKTVMVIVAGHPSNSASVPEEALNKKALNVISTWFECFPGRSGSQFVPYFLGEI
ncbi:hypothetical protein [Kiloniella sp.]|uniref:hypothetical protein n=1 Tax=Kiloniella sp. TaxID=1938587 RepID=UPI003A94068A